MTTIVATAVLHNIALSMHDDSISIDSTDDQQDLNTFFGHTGIPNHVGGIAKRNTVVSTFF